MILSGIKSEEYRDLNSYWANHFILCNGKRANRAYWKRFLTKRLTPVKFNNDPSLSFRQFKAVCFQLGYASDASRVTLRFEGLEIGSAKPEWSDNQKGNVFIIKLGHII